MMLSSLLLWWCCNLLVDENLVGPVVFTVDLDIVYHCRTCDKLNKRFEIFSASDPGANCQLPNLLHLSRKGRFYLCKKSSNSIFSAACFERKSCTFSEPCHTLMKSWTSDLLCDMTAFFVSSVVFLGKYWGGLFVFVLYFSIGEHYQSRLSGLPLPLRLCFQKIEWVNSQLVDNVVIAYASVLPT